MQAVFPALLEWKAVLSVTGWNDASHVVCCGAAYWSHLPQTSAQPCKARHFHTQIHCTDDDDNTEISTDIVLNVVVVDE